MKELLEQIALAEAQADEMLATARQEAKKILAEADAAVARIKAEQTVALKQLRAQKLAQAEAQAQAEFLAAVEDGNRQADEILARASRSTQAAAEYLVGRICNGDR